VRANFTLTKGDDDLKGTAGVDDFWGVGGGTDTLAGGDGRDTFHIDSSQHGSIDGGPGTDTSP
jgi:hypothetical protein